MRGVAGHPKPLSDERDPFQRLRWLDRVYLPFESGDQQSSSSTVDGGKPARALRIIFNGVLEPT